MRVVINSMQFSLRDFFLPVFLTATLHQSKDDNGDQEAAMHHQVYGNHLTGATILQENGACIWSERKTSTWRKKKQVHE